MSFHHERGASALPVTSGTQKSISPQNRQTSKLLSTGMSPNICFDNLLRVKQCLLVGRKQKGRVIHYQCWAGHGHCKPISGGDRARASETSVTHYNNIEFCNKTSSYSQRQRIIRTIKKALKIKRGEKWRGIMNFNTCWFYPNYFTSRTIESSGRVGK